MADIDEVLHQGSRGGKVVDHDRVGRDVSEFTVDAYNRKPLRDHVPNGPPVAAGGGEDKAVDALLLKDIQIHVFPFTVLLGVAENEIVAAGVAVNDVFDAEHEIGEEGVGDVGD